MAARSSKRIVFNFDPHTSSYDEQSGDLVVMAPTVEIPIGLRQTLTEMGLRPVFVHDVLDHIDDNFTMQWVVEKIVRK
jgi:hypothetical protein